MKRTFRLYHGKDARTVDVEGTGESVTLTVDGVAQTYTVRDVRAQTLLLQRADGATREVPFFVDRSDVHVQVDGHAMSFEVLDELQAVLRERRHAAGGGNGQLKVAMPGRVIQVSVVEGDRVEIGQGIVVVEAMKMENEMKAPATGTVKTVHVAVGAIVEAGTVLVTIDPDPD
jgi:acetyl/propionyl-CoA carboxylase alpha subunit